MKTTSEDKNLIALAGEYYVLSQLAERGIVGALTLGHTKSVDILAHNPRTGTVRRVEVKSTRQAPEPARLWHPKYERAHSWTMSEKHEAITDQSLVFCFVQLAARLSSGSEPHANGGTGQPRIFVVPAKEVARYVKWEHEMWRRSGAHGLRPENKMRRFRIEDADPNRYQDNWGLFE